MIGLLLALNFFSEFLEASNLSVAYTGRTSELGR